VVVLNLDYALLETQKIGHQLATTLCIIKPLAKTRLFVFLFELWNACLICVLVCCFIFATLEPTIDELGEEEDFEDFEEDQGQATQGKPSILVAYIYPSFTYASFSMLFFANCFVFNCFYPPPPLYRNLLATRLH
jgi:hypothetical protein